MADSFDYDYDTGSYAKNPVQVTRYRQNIQRFRDYGNVGQQSAPLAEGRLKEGIQPSSYRFEPPSAGVSADFYRDSRMRDPNQPPLDLSQITNLQYSRLFFGKEDDGAATPSSGGTTTRTSTPSGVVTTTTSRRRFPFRRARTESTVTPFTPQQTQAIQQTQAARAQRTTAAPAEQPARTPARRPIEPNPIQRVEPAAQQQQQRQLTPIQQRAVEQVQQQRRARQQGQSAPAQAQEQSPVSQRLDDIFGRLQQSAATPAAQSSTSRSKKRASRSGLGKVGRAILSETLPQARGYLDQ